VAISDVTLTGTATRFDASTQEDGTAALKVKGSSESRVDLSFQSTEAHEVKNNGSNPVKCWTSQSDGSYKQSSIPNCFTDASWFFPPLSSLIAKSNISITYVGQEKRNDILVDHVTTRRVISNQNPKMTDLLANFSEVNYYLDPISSLPQSITFKV